MRLAAIDNLFGPEAAYPCGDDGSAEADGQNERAGDRMTRTSRRSPGVMTQRHNALSGALRQDRCTCGRSFVDRGGRCAYTVKRRGRPAAIDKEVSRRFRADKPYARFPVSRQKSPSPWMSKPVGSAGKRGATRPYGESVAYNNWLSIGSFF